MEFNSQICTTKIQSERLLALGLKKETADMMFIVLVKDFHGKDIPVTERGYSLCTWYNETSMRVGLEKREYIPAWSLHRLIEMLGISKMAFNMDIYNSPYEEIIHRIETFVNAGEFNKEYLECI